VELTERYWGLEKMSAMRQILPCRCKLPFHTDRAQSARVANIVIVKDRSRSTLAFSGCTPLDRDQHVHVIASYLGARQRAVTRL